MSMIDFNTRLTPSAQAFTSTGAVSTDAFPLTQTGRDFLAGEPMAMVFSVTVSALTTGTTSYTFQAQTATASDGTTGAIKIATTPAYVFSSGTLANRDDVLEAGTQVVLALPPGHIMSTATHLAGFVLMANGSPTITCLIDIMPLRLVSQKYVSYADGRTFA